MALFSACYYFLSRPIGQIPPLGYFLDPRHGFWQNTSTETDIIKGEIELPGVKSPVVVRYDGQLIPHLFAQNNEDLYYTQGYITAKHRLWQMEFQTFAAAGRVSEVAGARAIPFDQLQRRKGLVFGAENVLKTMEEDAESLKWLEAYTQGINDYIAQLSMKDLPVEYKLIGYKPEPWTLLKTALLLQYMADMLAGSDVDLENTNLLMQIGKEQFDFLFPEFPKDSSPVIPNGTEWDFEAVTVEKPENIIWPLSETGEVIQKPHPQNGSNNWAVSGTKTKSGKPILANDPHLGLNLPSIWYVMQLNSPDVNAYGATLPGALGVIIGFNDSTAWGVTNATRDVRDWYAITFKDDSHDEYKYDGKWLKTQKRIEEIKVKGGETFYDTVVYTHHGPVVYDRNFKGEGQRINYALKWIGHQGGNQQKTFLQLNRANNLADYRAALQSYTAPAQNFVFASHEGDIALTVQGKFAVKWEEQGKFLMDGADPAYEWKAYIPFEHNAYVLNPERGFVTSANQHPTDENYPYYYYDHTFEHYRNRRIDQVLTSSDSITVEDMMKLQNDNYNLMAAEALPMMLRMVKMDTPLVAKYADVLRLMDNWDFRNEIEAEAATVFELWFDGFYRSVWDEFRAMEVPVRYPNSYQTIQMLQTDSLNQYFDIDSTATVETGMDLVRLAFLGANEAIEEWKSKQGSDTYDWATYKDTYIQHLLMLEPLSKKGVRVGGNKGIVNANSRRHGASWRMIVELGDKVKAYGIYPGGQSGNPGSKYYDNMIEDWAAGKYFEALFLHTPSEQEDKIIFTTIIKPESNE